MGVLVQSVVLALALPVGLLAGYGSPRLDNLLMRGVDMVHAFPDLLLIILLRSIFGGSLLTMVMAIGIGISPPTPSWGTMAQEGYSVISVAYEQVLFPVLAISVAMLAFTLLGEGLRDLLDPETGAASLGRPRGTCLRLVGEGRTLFSHYLTVSLVNTGLSHLKFTPRRRMLPCGA